MRSGRCGRRTGRELGQQLTNAKARGEGAFQHVRKLWTGRSWDKRLADFCR